MKAKFYVVFVGIKTGVFCDTWDNVKRLTDGYPDGLSKTYTTEALARKAYGTYRGAKTKVKKVKLRDLS